MKSLSRRQHKERNWKRPHVLRLVYNDKRCKGWQARLMAHTVAGTSRFYADKKYGGSRRARRLAERWLARSA